MAEYEKALEGARQYLFALQQADAMRLAGLLQEMISKAAGAEAYVAAKQAEVDKLTKECATIAVSKQDQQDRADAAKKAVDDIIAGHRALAEREKADHERATAALAEDMRKAQDEAASKQAKWEEFAKKFQAEIEAGKVATKKVYDEERTKLAADIDKLKSVKAQLEQEISGLKDRLRTLLGA